MRHVPQTLLDASDPMSMIEFVANVAKLFEAHADRPPVKSLQEFIANPEALIRHTRNGVLEQMQKLGRACMVVELMNRRVACLLVFDEMPERRDRKEYLAMTLKGVIQVCRIEAYAISSEVWMASESPDPGVKELLPSERSDRQEGVMIVNATRRSYRVSVFNTLRDDDGTVRNLKKHRDLGRSFIENPVLENLFEES